MTNADMYVLSETGIPDPLSEEAIKCPYPYFRKLRDYAPVVKAPGHDFYIVSRYAEVVEVLKNPDIFSADYLSLFNRDPQVAAILAEGEQSVSTLATLDPPEHGRYRRLVNKAFSPSRVNAIAVEIAERTEVLIDSFIDDGQFDIVAQFAVPLTISITAGQLGIPQQDLWKFKRWSDARVVQFSLLTTFDEEREAARRRLEFQSYFADLLEAKRAQPTDDIISVLAITQFDDLDRALTLPEFLSLAEQLMTAGNLTTTHTFASGMVQLLRMPAEIEALRRDPDRIRPFIEELLRIESPVAGIWRKTKVDTVLGGVAIPAGSAIHVRLSSANRDDRKFPDAEILDVDRRNPGSHVAFGSGAHFCIGFMLAKRELEIGFNSLLRRLTNCRLLHPEQAENYMPSFTVHGLPRLDISFDKA